MHSCRLECTYTTSDGMVSAYACVGNVPSSKGRSGVDHAGGITARVIGTGSLTGTDKRERESVAPDRKAAKAWLEYPGSAAQRRREGSHRQRALSVVRIGRVEHDASRRTMCANTSDGKQVAFMHRTRTNSTSGNCGWPMTLTSRMHVLPENEKDRCANTGLSQEESSVVVVVALGNRSDRRQTA
jgi:hypothetical protein